MGEVTKIQWCDHTFNPWRGCAKVSAGCLNCYAEAEAKRFAKNRGVWGPNGTRVVASEAIWHDVVKWHRAAWLHDERATVFTASLADWLEDWPGQLRDANEQPMFVGPNGVWRKGGDFPARERALWEPMRLAHLRDRLLALIAEKPLLIFLLLTKRPEHWSIAMREVVALGVRGISRGGHKVASDWLHGNPPPNVRVGASVEDQENTSRIEHLLKIPGPNFLSVEPLLGPIDFSRWMHPFEISRDSEGNDLGSASGGSDIEWAIVGGESGHHARPCDLSWIASIVTQCQNAAVPVFVKQLGACPTIDRDGVWIPLLDPKGGDPGEWPEDLRIREFPEVTA